MGILMLPCQPYYIAEVPSQSLQRALSVVPQEPHKLRLLPRNIL